jgi:hypothetical protein
MKPPPHRYSGQALAESLLLLLVLIPLAMAIESLTRLAMTQQTILGAVRHTLMEHVYAAKVTTTSRPTPQFLADLELHSDDLAYDRDTVATLSPALFAVQLAEPVGPGELELASFAATRMQGRWSFQESSALSFFLREQPIIFDESLLVLTDTWQTTGSDHLASQIRAISVAGRLQQIAAPLELMRGVLSVIEPAFSRFCPGRIVLETVPPDRLPASVVVGNDGRREAC